MSRAAPLSPPERRATLLAAARQVFAQKGYHPTSVSDILEVAGVARGTFYNHFESKRDVFAAVLVGLMEEALAAVEPIVVERPILPQVESNLLRITRALAAQGDAARILFTDASSVDADGEEALSLFYVAALDRVERALVRGQGLGVVRAGETRQTARCLLGLLKEPVIQARLAREPLDADAVAAAILGLLQAGLLTPAPR